MSNLATKIVKKVSLETLYEIIDKRTDDIRKSVEQVKNRQEEDFRYLSQKIDTQMSQIRQEIGQINQRFDQVNQRFDQVNQRLDTVIQLIMQKN